MKHKKKYSNKTGEKVLPINKNITSRSSAVSVFLARYQWYIVGILTLTGFIMRLYNVGFLTLWVDEYVHANAAKIFVTNNKLSVYDLNGILLTLSDCVFAKLFGLSDKVVRLPVVITGTLAIPALFYFAKRVLNTRVAIIATTFLTFSPFMVFWSRVDRMYGFVPFTYLLLATCFWLALEGREIDGCTTRPYSIHKKYFWLLPVAFLAAMLSQIQSFLFFFTAGFYCTFVFIENLFTRRIQNKFFNVYALFTLLNLMAITILFTPLAQIIMAPIIEKFLNKSMANMILPDWKVLKEIWHTDDWNKSALKYYNVTAHDISNLQYFGWAGFAILLFIKRKAAYFLMAAFVVPVLIMGFILREPNHAKYLSYIYPFFLMAAASAFYGIYLLVKKISASNSFLNFYQYASTCVMLAVTIAILPFKDDWNIITSSHHGPQTNEYLSEISFVNWKEAFEFLKRHRQKGDVVLSTVTSPFIYYGDIPGLYTYRQAHYDALQRKYVLNSDDSNKTGGNTYNQIVSTIKNNRRGWLFGDYYFNNALSDPKANTYCIQNMHFYFDSLKDGSVQALSWDTNHPELIAKSLLLELGKPCAVMPLCTDDNNNYTTSSLELQIPAGFVIQPQMDIHVLAQGINSNREAFIVINGTHSIFVPYSPPGAGGYQNIVFSMNGSFFKAGKNEIAFGYNTDKEDNGDKGNNGFVIYNFNLFSKPALK